MRKEGKGSAEDPLEQASVNLTGGFHGATNFPLLATSVMYSPWTGQKIGSECRSEG